MLEKISRVMYKYGVQLDHLISTIKELKSIMQYHYLFGFSIDSENRSWRLNFSIGVKVDILHKLSVNGQSFKTTGRATFYLCLINASN